jgi:type II secretory pathway component PulF
VLAIEPGGQAVTPDPDEVIPQNPRRAGPPTGSAKKGGGKPARAPIGGDPEASTFRPNPVGAGSRSKTGSTRSRGSGTSDGGFSEPLAPGPKWWERIFFGRVSSGQLAQFCRQFAAYLNAGVDYNKTFSSLEKQFAMTALGPALSRMRQSIKAGSTLEEAMSREKQIFSTMFLSMIRVAEARGGVPETLRMMGNHYEARQRLIRQARSAMIYPAIVLIIAGGVVALITIVLLPMFASMLQDISHRAQLPWASRALLAFSSFIGFMGWWLLPLLMIGIPFLLIRLYKTPPGKAMMDRVILFTPVFGPLFRKLDTSRFARTLSTLLDAGVDVGSSIELTAGVVTMTPISQAIRNAREKVIQGRELSVALADSRQFSPDVLAVLSSGEETGKIPESLNHLADDYEEQVAMMVKNMGHLIQPLLVLILGGIVLFIILAVFLPYIQMITSLAGP